MKCRHCKKAQNNHSAADKSCPLGKKHKTLGYIQYSTKTKFEAQPEKSILLEEYEFLKSVLLELNVDPERYDFGPAFELAKSRHKLAKVKINRLIKQERMRLDEKSKRLNDNITFC